MRFAAGIIAISCTALLVPPYSSPARAASTDIHADARKAFQEAYARVPTEKPDAPTHDGKVLKSYPLYPYLEAARIRQALTTTTGGPGRVDQRAGDFLIAYPQAPVSRSVRHAWLDNLAHREQWNLFLEVYRDSMSDITVRCESFTARINLGKTQGLGNEITAAWLTPRSLPDCEGPFAWLKDNGLLTPDLIERRARQALENGNVAFARQLLPQLSQELAAPLMQWAQLLESSAHSIDDLIANPNTPAEQPALLAGWTHLARNDSQAAKSRYQDLLQSRGLNKETASPYALVLALALAWDRDPEALKYFDLVQPKDLDDAALEWRARAALWSKAWDVATKSIAAMSLSSRQSARWRYWLARITELQGESAQAQGLYAAVLADDNYYSAMAAAHLSRPVVPHPQPIPVQPGVLSRVEHLPSMERARELFLCGMRSEALAEWHEGYESLYEDGRTQAVRLAATWGWYEQAVQVAATQHIYNDYVLLYPRPYDAEVNAAAQAAQLTPEMVYAVMRQESLYRVDAVSSAGARGLMQLQPSTAQRAARYSKRATPSVEDLFVPSVNTSLGAARLRMLLDQFEGQTPLALAGYNAGANAVMRWLPQQPVDADIWIENIPYNETRGYVQRVLWHSLMFTWLGRDHEAQETTSWLAPIKPLHGAEDRVATTAPRRTS
jgi:soluble lytic murein transglycosylase